MAFIQENMVTVQPCVNAWPAIKKHTIREKI